MIASTTGEQRPPRVARTPIGRVLIVDDETLLLRPLKQILSSAGYEVETSESPFDALEIVAHGSFDVALLDLRMPGMNGIELLGKLKAAQPEIEVVMMTAFGTVEDAFKAVK